MMEILARTEVGMRKEWIQRRADIHFLLVEWRSFLDGVGRVALQNWCQSMDSERGCSGWMSSSWRSLNLLITSGGLLESARGG
jgi:hypothetical protein